MLYLSLFSGAGGGDLAAQHLLGWTCAGYVEWDDYCQRILSRRQEDEALDRAPIYGDIRAFIDEGYADAYAGMVDVITGGFPCQPFSAAGKMLAGDDPRNMWPATIRAISTIRPRYAYLENVPGLAASGYFGTILGDLAAAGYDARWRILSAAELGAPHKRDRLWILAHAGRSEQGRRQQQERGEDQRNPDATRHGTQGHVVADAESQPIRPGLCESESAQERRRRSSHSSRQNHAADTSSERLAEREGQEGERTHPATAGSSWWATEPTVGRVADGVANRVDRLKAIGNGQVPAVAAAAWHLLSCVNKPD